MEKFDDASGRRAAPAALARVAAVLLVALIAALAAGCIGSDSTAAPAPSPADRSTAAIPTPTRFPIGSPTGDGIPAPLRESVAMLRRVKDGAVAGAAIVIASDGFLVTTDQALADPVEVVLPNGDVARPVQVTRDDSTGLTLLKVPADHLVPVQFRASPPAIGDEVFAAGFETAHTAFAQMGGHLEHVTVPAGAPSDAMALFQTDIPLVDGFTGGALSDTGGALVGLIVPGESEQGTRVVCALSREYITTWIEGWRQEVQDLVADSESWQVLTVDGKLSLRYPSGWSVMQASGDARSYHADLGPQDPDVPLGLSVSIEESSDAPDPMAFARKEFGDRKDALIWGAVRYAGVPGVRVVLNQEGARVDVVYLFDGGSRIGLSLTSGYGSDTADEQSKRATAVFEAVLRSLEIGPGPG